MITETPQNTENLALMPRNTYGEDRGFAFEMCARHLGIRELELRVALSNVFLLMSGQRTMKWRY